MIHTAFSSLTRTFGLTLLLLITAFSAASADTATPTKQGHLYLVSAGIGDPDNITIRALKILERADIIFAMQGTVNQFADLLKDKEVHEAGHGLFGMGEKPKIDSHMVKAPSPPKEATSARRMALDPQKQAEEQSRSRKIIRDGIAAGKTVVVLDYGDPTIYGPQIGYMSEFADLHPEIIPGVSSFNAANAALKRGLVGNDSNAIILTSAGAARRGITNNNLEILAKSRSTMVFFTMGMDLPEVVRQLKTGYPGSTPIAIVSHAGLKEKEAVLHATLDTVVAKTSGGKLPFEHLIYVGDFLK
jgi:precorrin-4 methylase